MVDSGKLRFIVIDGSTVQEPGATATTYRLHIAIDLINLSLHQVEVTTDKAGENLDHYTLAAGDVVLIDRGYNQPKTLVPFIDRGGDVVLRYNAHSMSLYENGEGEDAGHLVKIDWHTRLRKLDKHPSGVPVWLCHGNNASGATFTRSPYPKKKPHKRGAKPDNAPKTRDATPVWKPYL